FTDFAAFQFQLGHGGMTMGDSYNGSDSLHRLSDQISANTDEDMAAERIGADDLLHLCRQPIEPGPQIDRLAGQKHLGTRCQADHPSPFTAASTRRSAFSLTPPSTRTRTPSGRSISITPARSANVRPAPRGPGT